MTIQPGAAVYTQGFGTRPENVEVPTFQPRIPATTDTNWPLGKRWIDTVANSEYVLTSFSTSNGVVSANWALLGSAGGALNTLTGDSGGAISPSAGNISILGTSNEISTTGSGSTITLALAGPHAGATYTAHGVLVGEGTSPFVATAAGTNGQVLIAATGADPAFATISSSGSTLTLTGGANTLNIDVTAPLNVAHGGTGATTLTGVLTGNGTSAVTANAVTNHGVLLGGASNAVSSLGVAATGTVLAGSTGADPAFTGSPSVSGSLTAATTITATLGAITATNGNVVLGTAGNKLVIATGANASVGTSGAMAGTPGAVIVATTASSATAKIFYSRATAGGTLGNVSITAQDGTGFTLTSDANETSTFNWWIINA